MGRQREEVAMMMMGRRGGRAAACSVCCFSRLKDGSQIWTVDIDPTHAHGPCQSKTSRSLLRSPSYQHLPSNVRFHGNCCDGSGCGHLDLHFEGRWQSICPVYEKIFPPGTTPLPDPAKKKLKKRTPPPQTS